MRMTTRTLTKTADNEKEHAKMRFKRLAAEVRVAGEIEKHHEERYRALLKNIETAQIFEKSEVKVWECRNCGHIVVGTKAPGVCPVCNHRRATLKCTLRIIDGSTKHI